LASKEYHSFCLPAINDQDRAIPLCNGSSWLWRKGDLLIPQRLDRKELDSLKATMPPWDFAAQYDQAPVPESGIVLNREWLVEDELLPIRQPGDLVVTSWDTAHSLHQNAAYSVGATFLVRNKNQFFLIDACRERLAYTDLKRRVIEQADQHKPDWILIEDKSTGTPLIDELKRMGRHHRRNVAVLRMVIAAIPRKRHSLGRSSTRGALTTALRIGLLQALSLRDQT
jgi:hypothetical protein